MVPPRRETPAGVRGKGWKTLYEEKLGGGKVNRLRMSSWLIVHTILGLKEPDRPDRPNDQIDEIDEIDQTTRSTRSLRSKLQYRRPDPKIYCRIFT